MSAEAPWRWEISGWEKMDKIWENYVNGKTMGTYRKNPINTWCIAGKIW
jgi:hypothetical protein